MRDSVFWSTSPIWSPYPSHLVHFRLHKGWMGQVVDLLFQTSILQGFVRRVKFQLGIDWFRLNKRVEFICIPAFKKSTWASVSPPHVPTEWTNSEARLRFPKRTIVEHCRTLMSKPGKQQACPQDCCACAHLLDVSFYFLLPRVVVSSNQYHCVHTVIIPAEWRARSRTRALGLEAV